MFALLLLLFLLPPTAEEAILTVEVNGFRTDNGTVIMRLWDDKETWLKKEGVRVKVKTQILRGRAVYTFSDIKPGKYALALVHDENSNGHLDMNFAKIPKEGVGASNNASSTFRAPKFEDALFTLKPGEKKKLVIDVKYYL